MRISRIIVLLLFLFIGFSVNAQYRDPSKNKAKKEKNREGSPVSFRKQNRERVLQAEADPFRSRRKKAKPGKNKESDPFKSGGKRKKKKEKKYKNTSKVRKTQKTKDPFKKPKRKGKN